MGKLRVTAACLGLSVALPCIASAHPFDDLPPGHWMVGSTNTIDELDPCPNQDCAWSAIEGVSGVIDDWNGGAFATGFGELGGLVVFGGGHNGYFGNELYVLDVAAMQWVRHTEPVDNPSCDQATGELQDGSPCSAHTYDYLDYHPGTNSFVELGSASNHEVGGGGAPYVHLFSFDDNAWRRGGHPFSSFGGHTGASSAYDPTRDVFFVIPAYNNDRLMFDPNANGGEGTWTEYPPYNIDIDAVSAVDPTRDLLVTVDGRGAQSIVVHDLANFEADGVIVPLDGGSDVMSIAGPGFEWDPVAELLVGWASGASVWTLTPPDGDWRTGMWTWSEILPADDNPVEPTAPNANNTYSRWRYMSTVNAYAVVNHVSETAFVYKLSEGGGTGPVDPPTDTDDGGSDGNDDDAGDGSTGGTSGTTSGPSSESSEDAEDSTGAAASSGATGPAVDGEGSDDGCGCRSVPGATAWWLLVFVGLTRPGSRRRSRCR